MKVAYDRYVNTPIACITLEPALTGLPHAITIIDDKDALCSFLYCNNRLGMNVSTEADIFKPKVTIKSTTLDKVNEDEWRCVTNDSEEVGKFIVHDKSEIILALRKGVPDIIERLERMGEYNLSVQLCLNSIHICVERKEPNPISAVLDVLVPDAVKFIKGTRNGLVDWAYGKSLINDEVLYWRIVGKGEYSVLEEFEYSRMSESKPTGKSWALDRETFVYELKNRIRKISDVNKHL